MDGTILEADEGFLSNLGYLTEEVIGKKHSIFLQSGEASSERYAQFWEELRQGRFLGGEHPRRRKDGGVVWIRGAYNPIPGPDGRPDRVIKYATDITAEKLRKEDYEGQIEAIGRSQAVVEFTLAGVVVSANTKFLEMMGYEPDEVLGRHHSMFMDGETRGSEDYRAFWRGLQQGGFTAGEYKRLGKHGREVWIQATYTPIQGLDGKPYKVVKYASDVSEAKLVAANFQGQIEAIRKSQAVIEFDLNGYILDANDNFLRVLGAQSGDVLGKHHRTFVPPEEYGTQAYEEFWQALREGQYRSGEFRRIDMLGNEVWLQASYNPIRDLNGAPFKIVKFASDVTQLVTQRRREADLETARQAAEASAKAKSDFLATMSHELRTPLTSILGFSKLIGRNGPLSDKDREYLDLIRSAGETLLRVVNDILEFSRLESDDIPLLIAAFEPRSLVEGVCLLLEEQARDKGLVLTCELDNLEIDLEGDGPRIRQILLNLVSNAIKFTDQGAVSVRGSVREAVDDTLIFEVSIEDTGVGMSSDQMARVFDRFTQADASISRRFGGTGLGLAISKKLIETMGGEIGVESEEGAGSRFWFRIPLQPGVRLAQDDVEQSVEIDRPLSLLMADDHAANRQLVAALLSAMDVDIEFAEDGQLAVVAAGQRKFDVILMDMQMPVMDGIAATREIRAANGPNQETPIIALTANIMQDHVKQCFDAGMQEHVGKPIDPHTLIDAISRQLLGPETISELAA